MPRAKKRKPGSRGRKACYSYEAGREIYRKGEPFIGVTREGKTRPTVADKMARDFVKMLNRRGRC
jgi:hypothetical protein